MRRSRAAALLIVALTLVPPSGARAEAPALAAENTIISVGSQATLVTLTKTMIVPLGAEWYTTWMSFETTGSYAGVGLQALAPEPGHTIRKMLLNVRLMPPVGCTTHGVCDSADEQTNMRWIAHASFDRQSIVFEPGTYLLYAFTDPGATMTARWHLPMLSGDQDFTPSMPVQFQTKATTVTPLVGIGTLEGKHTGHLAGDGLVYAWLWDTYLLHSETQYLGFNVQLGWQCIQRTDDRADPLGQCGFPFMLNPGDESGTFMWSGGIAWPADTGDWSHVFRFVDVTPPDGRLGAFTFWFTFFSP